MEGALQPAPPGSGIPAWLRAALVRGLARDPAARYPSVEALLAALADDPERGGPLRLALTATRGPRAWAQAVLRRVEVRGAAFAAEREVGAAEDPALDAARRRFVEGDLVGALAALAEARAPEVGDRMVAVAALAGLGRWAEAEAALGPLFADLAAEAALDGPLKALLRVDPGGLGALPTAPRGPRRSRRGWRRRGSSRS